MKIVTEDLQYDKLADAKNYMKIYNDKIEQRNNNHNNHGAPNQVLVAYDRRNFIGLDHELRLELVDLVHCRRSRGGVGIRDRDQVGHRDPPSSRDVRSDQSEHTW